LDKIWRDMLDEEKREFSQQKKKVQCFLTTHFYVINGEDLNRPSFTWWKFTSEEKTKNILNDNIKARTIKKMKALFLHISLQYISFYSSKYILLYV